MYKQLKLYYLQVILPYVLLLLGAALYSDAIMGTITRNPHPQINYAIFVIIIIGGTLIIRNVFLLMSEAKELTAFSAAMRANTDPATMQERAINFQGAISYVLRRMTAAIGSGRAISHHEQTAIERELGKAYTRLTRNNVLPQFLVGLLVGMGLLGTFIGLLSTLNDIAALISSFADIDMNTASPIDVFRTMIERMKAPMRSMGIAFSASLFGILGSIIIGLMMVGIRRFQGDIHSFLSSEVAQYIDFSLPHDDSSSSKGGLRRAPSRLRGEMPTTRDIAARSTRQAEGELYITVPYTEAASGKPGADGGTDSTGSTGTPAESASGELGDIEASTLPRILMRIEERMAEAENFQSRRLNADIDDFQKQRGDMLRTLAEQNESSNNFRSELQRLGRQLATILKIMETTDTEVSTQLSELVVRISADGAETQRLLNLQIEEQQKLNESLTAYFKATSVMKE